MFSISRVLCGVEQPNDRLRFNHKRGPAQEREATPRPVVVWAVTRACNLRCVHCYASADAEPAPDELTTAEGLTLLDDLARFGVPAVLFSGGEPLARPDLFELLRHAQALGLPATLSTNGTLITPQVAARLAELGLRYVGVSLDGGPATHNKLRGAADAFQRATAGIEHCQHAGLRVGVRFTVHALNVHELEDVFHLCVERGIDRLCVYHLAYAGRGGKMQRADLTAAQTRAAMNRLFRLTRLMHDEGGAMEVLTVGNHADAGLALLQLEAHDPAAADAARHLLQRNGGNRSGANICSIDPVGGVHYDQFSWHYRVGNVRHATFSEIWRHPTDPRLRALRRRPDALPDACHACRFLDVCNGNLRTRAEAATGDWLGLDPSCYLTDPERRARPHAAT
jgi:radical SAM protein with 4Fe4S-binding SPASM domain